MKIAAVVPSIREKEIGLFLDSWESELKEAQVKLYIVEDSADKNFSFDKSLQLNHLSWEDAPQDLLDCITTKSPSCRQIGIWKAYHDGADIIVTLDDDVRSARDSGSENFFLQFGKILSEGVPRWVDPMLNYRSRGYPINNVGELKSSFHVGGFLNIPDVDAETQKVHQENFSSIPPLYQPKPVIVSTGQLIPVNGGICGWRSELTPYVHWTLWSSELSYYRYDDIWMGIILKNLLDYTGLRMSYGPPFVEHIRASDLETNLRREKEGKVWNEEFWETLYNNLSNDSRLSKSSELGLDETFEIISDVLGKIENTWAKKEAKAMLQWRALFD